MIYLDACALIKFVKREKETVALETWRDQLDHNTHLMTSELARIELSRALLRAGGHPERVPQLVARALRRVYLADVTKDVLATAMSYKIRKLASLDAIHLATAEPFRDELTEFVTYDSELADAATELGLPVSAPT